MAQDDIKYMFHTPLFVEDVFKQQEVLIKNIGLHPTGPESHITNSPEAVSLVCRWSAKLTDSPTRLELIETRDAWPHWNNKHMADRWRAQEHRPMRWHYVVLVADIDTMAEEMRRRGTVHLLDDHLPFRRLVIGVSEDDPSVYDPLYDAGLQIEFLPLDGFPAPEGPPTPGSELPPGSMMRSVRWSFLVADLDERLRNLERYLGWVPKGPVEDIAVEGYRRAVLDCSVPHSARLQLVEPYDTSKPAGEFMEKWGPGSYWISVLTNDLQAKEDDLKSRGVPYSITPPHPELGPRLQVDPAALDGAMIEFVAEDPDSGLAQDG